MPGCEQRIRSAAALGAGFRMTEVLSEESANLPHIPKRRWILRVFSRVPPSCSRPRSAFRSRIGFYPGGQIEGARGIVVRERASIGGTVFAVVWKGRSVPHVKGLQPLGPVGFHPDRCYARIRYGLYTSYCSKYGTMVASADKSPPKTIDKRRESKERRVDSVLVCLRS